MNYLSRIKSENVKKIAEFRTCETASEAAHWATLYKEDLITIVWQRPHFVVFYFIEN